MQLRPMRLQLFGLLISAGLGFGISALPAQAQFSDPQVSAFVEALRQASAPDDPKDTLHSDWQVKAENIPRWSKACLGREITPAQFENSPVTARSILVCVTRDVLKDELRAAQNDRPIAVRRTAAWWMTGDATRYATGDTAAYTQKVLTLYQQQVGATAATAATAAAPSTPYDRYMKVGYAASKQKDYAKALLYFQRALDERPEDTYATQAIRNVEGYMKGGSARPGSPTAASPGAVPASASPATGVPNAAPIAQPVSQPGMPSAVATPLNSAVTPPLITFGTPAPTAMPTPLTSDQAIALINQWLRAKAQIFAPPFDQTQVSNLTTGELAAALLKPEGVLAWLKQRQAYYRYGVQKLESVDRFVAMGDRATIEVTLTEDRTLYVNGTVEPTQTEFAAKQVRYSLEQANGNWKIADYKTVDGRLLERAILGTTQSASQSEAIEPRRP